MSKRRGIIEGVDGATVCALFLYQLNCIQSVHFNTLKCYNCEYRKLYNGEVSQQHISAVIQCHSDAVIK